MRQLVLGDIHGCYDALITLAETVRFRPDDQLITLGDYIDRGPDSRAVLDWLVRFSRSGRLISLLGNHEIMLLLSREDPLAEVRWLPCGGAETLASYAPDGEVGKITDIPAAHWEFLERRCRGYFETPTHLFVHANAHPDKALSDQSNLTLFWEKFEGSPAATQPHISGKTLICGHTAQMSGRPKNLGHAICIDTCPYADGWLTCLDVDTGHYWQANQEGASREGTLEACVA